MKPNSRPLTIAVGACLVFIMLMTPLSDVRGADTPQQSDTTTHIFPTFGVELTLPTGWWRVLPYKHLQVATIEKVKEQTNIPLAMIRLEVLSPQPDVPDAQTMAAQFAQKLNTESIPLPGGVGGCPAFQILHNKATPEVGPVETVLVDRGDQIVGATLVSEGTGEDQRAGLTEVLQGIRWLEPEDPLKHLTFAKERLRIGEGKYRLRVPSIIRGQPVNGRDYERMLGIVDRRKNQLEFAMSIHRVPLSGDQNIDEFAKKFGDGIQRRFQIAKPFLWQDAGLTVPSRFSNTVVVTGTNCLGYGVVFSDAEALILTFTYPAATRERLPTYMALAHQIVRTMEVADGPLPTSMRTWTGANGNLDVEARIIEFPNNDRVILQKADASLVQVPMAELSKPDREFAISVLGDEFRHFRRRAARLANAVPSRYHNKTLGFSIQFPKGFEDVTSDQQGSDVLYGDSHGASLSIGCHPAPPGVDVSDLVQTLRENLAKRPEREEIKFVGGGSMQIGGKKAEYTMTSGTSREATHSTYHVIFGQHWLMLHTVAPSDRFDKYKPVFDECAKSLRFD